MPPPYVVPGVHEVRRSEIEGGDEDEEGADVDAVFDVDKVHVEGARRPHAPLHAVDGRAQAGGLAARAVHGPFTRNGESRARLEARERADDVEVVEDGSAGVDSDVVTVEDDLAVSRREGTTDDA